MKRDLPATSKPYKGPESYQIEDGDFFFGRDVQSDQLIAKILSSRLTVLHAQSGAGKTSLLNARVIPGLQSRGWFAVRVLPQNDPIRSTSLTTLHAVLPPPEAECEAMLRAKQALATDGEDLTLAEALDRYDRIDKGDRRRRDLISKVPLPEGKYEGFDQASPVFCRLLRSTLEIEDYVEHLAALAPRDDAASILSIDGSTRLSALISSLSGSQFLASYSSLRSALNNPELDLWSFFEALVNAYGSRRTRFAIVILFDQFEELFTRFVDAGQIGGAVRTGKPLDWRLRWKFFEELETLYKKEFIPAATDKLNLAARISFPLPIRYVISLRNEYLAQLDPISRFSQDLTASSYHLQLLTVDEAREAIEQPARLFGYGYSDQCYATIMSELSKEDRFVEPAHLQIVCEKLWQESGRELAKVAHDEKKSLIPEIPETVFVQLGGTRGILNSFFREFLSDLEEQSRLESLEMLETLVTTSGTRNILERSQLLNAPFRSPATRTSLLGNLVDRTIVRVERRLGGYFVEITHEFLIGPILEAIRKDLNQNADYSRFRWALLSLERMRSVDYRAGVHRLLTEQEFETLHKNRERIQWSRWNTELMLRSAVGCGAENVAVMEWAGRYGAEPELDPVVMLNEELVTDGGRKVLSLEELGTINMQRAELKLSYAQTEFILRSTIVQAVDRDREDIRYWSQKVLSYG